MNASSQTLSAAPAVLPLSEVASFRARQELRERNELAYETTVAYCGLPSSTHIAVRATESSVLVTATDIDVLGIWLDVRGGMVKKTDLPFGQVAWTLVTTTWSDSPLFPPVPVFVTVVLPSDEPVMHEIRAAVAA